MNDALITEKKRRFSVVWFIPLISLLIAIWMVVSHVMNQGPQITLTFASAEGLVAGQTRVKRLSVDLGVVTSVSLNEGYNDVSAVVQLDKDAEDLLRADTQFWVVKPQFKMEGVSGLSTLLSGAYIELSPGVGKVGKRSFRGLDTPPQTPQSANGARFKLVSDRAGSVSVGNPVYYNGYRVGTVDKTSLSVEDGKGHYELFIHAPFHDLVNSNTRFWNASGVNISSGAAGVSVQMESLQTLLFGGIAFGLPEGIDPGTAVESGQQFTLYKDYKATTEQPYRWGQEYLILFDSSVRGLTVGAPVEYRGIKVGTVLAISFDLVPDTALWTEDHHARLPVLIRIDPGRIFEDTEQALGDTEQFLIKAVANGLRVTLGNGSLLTGALYVNLDYFDNVEPAGLSILNNHTILPTIDTGFAQIQQQVSNLLDKFQKLPLESTVTSATGALNNMSDTAAKTQQTLANLDKLLTDPQLKQVPAEVTAAIRELRKTVAGVSPESPVYGQLQEALLHLNTALQDTSELMKSLKENPNTLIFPRPAVVDPIPRSAPQSIQNKR